MTQKRFLLNLLSKNKRAVIIGSLGTISYDLAEIPHKNKILVKGAMGCVLGVGLGFALKTKKQVYVLIGDGALLMKLGSLATIKKYNQQNLHIIVMDNGRHESTGGQLTNFREIEKYIKPLCEVVKVNEIHDKI